MSHIQLKDVCVGAADHKSLFPPLNLSISHEVVGLVGRNGCGKSSLLTLVAGDQVPASGSISVEGTVAYMRQGPFAERTSIAQALDVEPSLDTLSRIERGQPRNGDLERADWDLPMRLEQIFAQVGLSDLSLEKPAWQLSGGQQCRVKLARLLLARADILLLDEPTNDLDEEGRAMIARLLNEWNGPALVASHDRALLGGMDRLIELSPAGVLNFGGGWTEFAERRDAIRDRAQGAFEEAKRRSKQAKAVHRARSERQAKRSRHGKMSSSRSGDSKLEISARKRRAEKTAARTEVIGQEQLGATQAAVEAASAFVEQVAPVQIELPRSELQSGHRVLDATSISCSYDEQRVFGPLNLVITGPERIALVGRNGAGKSSLLRVISGELSPSGGCVLTDQQRIAVLDQHLSLLEPGQSALALLQRHNPILDKREAHAALARYGFRADWSQREVSTLSGGERVRLSLACLFSGPISPHLLILDEPTNHLDIYAIEMLEAALREYDGAIICASHDVPFRAALKLDRIVDLDVQEALLT